MPKTFDDWLEENAEDFYADDHAPIWAKIVWDASRQALLAELAKKDNDNA